MRLWAKIGGAVVAALACFAAGRVQAADTLDIYFVDAGRAFGANATIVVAPSGESAMLDAGLPNQAPNVLELFKQAGVKQLDYLVNTHFHTDHFGGTAQLAEGIPISHFIDHGESVEYGKSDAWWKEPPGRLEAAVSASGTTPLLRDVPRGGQARPADGGAGGRRDSPHGD